MPKTAKKGADPRRAGARWKSERKGQPENHQLNRYAARRKSDPPTKRRKTDAREKRGGTENAIFAKDHTAATRGDVQGKIDGNSSKAKTHFGGTRMRGPCAPLWSRRKKTRPQNGATRPQTQSARNSAKKAKYCKTKKTFLSSRIAV